jgi:hypothetical protein
MIFCQTQEECIGRRYTWIFPLCGILLREMMSVRITINVDHLTRMDHGVDMKKHGIMAGRMGQSLTSNSGM